MLPHPRSLLPPQVLLRHDRQYPQRRVDPRQPLDQALQQLQLGLAAVGQVRLAELRERHAGLVDPALPPRDFGHRVVAVADDVDDPDPPAALDRSDEPWPFLRNPQPLTRSDHQQARHVAESARRVQRQRQLIRHPRLPVIRRPRERVQFAGQHPPERRLADAARAEDRERELAPSEAVNLAPPRFLDDGQRGPRPHAEFHRGDCSGGFQLHDRSLQGDGGTATAGAVSPPQDVRNRRGARCHGAGKAPVPAPVPDVRLGPARATGTGRRASAHRPRKARPGKTDGGLKPVTPD